MPVGQSLVVKAQQMQHGGVEVVHMHRVLHDLVAEVIRHPVGGAGLHPAAGDERNPFVLEIREVATGKVRSVEHRVKAAAVGVEGVVTGLDDTATH